MIIEKVTFLIPIYPPHYQFIYNLINKLELNDIQIDIHLVFSNIEDHDKFSMKNKINSIILPKSYKTNSIITYKKFFGLQHLSNSKYDYIICCDSEIDIICDNFTNQIINDKIKQIFDNKTIYAGDVSIRDVNNILQTSANLFPENYEYLRDITNNFTLYFWWSDLPVYRREDIIPFFNTINYDNIVFEHFDYMIYQYYLILYSEFKIINTTPITNLGWSLEMLKTTDNNILNALLSINYGFSWNNINFYKLNKQFIESQKGFLIYHLNRNKWW
jgi:hypothetical protein